MSARSAIVPAITQGLDVRSRSDVVVAIDGNRVQAYEVDWLSGNSFLLAGDSLLIPRQPDASARAAFARAAGFRIEVARRDQLARGAVGAG